MQSATSKTNTQAKQNKAEFDKNIKIYICKSLHTITIDSFYFRKHILNLSEMANLSFASRRVIKADKFYDIMPLISTDFIVKITYHSIYRRVRHIFVKKGISKASEISDNVPVL